MPRPLYLEPDCNHEGAGAWCGKCQARQRWVVPVEPDYEAFDEAIRQLTEHTTESIANVLEGTATIDDMRQESAVPWRNRLLDALGIGGDE